MEFDQIQYAGLSDVGVRRSHNQDTFEIQPAPDASNWQTTGHVFLVADGMGGHAVGEKASAKAKREIPHTYIKYAHEGASSALRRAFQETNAGIFAIGQQNPEFKGLGTTATALVIRPDGAWVGHVGDSRCYRLRNGVMEQLSYDHSLAWMLARQQGVDPDELTDIRKNVIVRSLGPDSLVQVDVEGPHPVQPGDVFLLCSDGLSNPLSPEEIGLVIGLFPPKEACEMLVELANLKGGPDNITVVIARVGTDLTGSRTMTAIRPNPLRELGRKIIRAVPWPMWALGSGFLLAAGFFAASFTEIPGRSVLLVLALISIIIGLIGLGMEFTAQADQPEEEEEPHSPRQSIYRKHPCPVDLTQIERIGKVITTLKQHLEQKSWNVSWEAFSSYMDQVQSQRKANHLADALRASYRALVILAQSYNRQRQKEEVFQPKWD
ncbi:PP2C family protein-serine/threonine phosphatase [Tuwongella immobilis]|uniref:PPM-type phosphatase domain-containing protein n=1 Tax=Tuwongella immobilis TaxID=692036 RepID=A0A6C2YKQ3_9BACT|nr:protein phosphatase 2C domain-containing protein [Tuwongella immobilis]VIP01809.1 protein serine threonine phosphatase : Probable protein phosphatase 1 OS=Blastopirellula marina DSM 3645 GN=DSM3645_18026 PE=4 SV=1: PP2C_2 [Tuwongella immobilis]VTR99516.1 protein serine threonine phosphatase : Probable protein phosphatase 1 OS=Blastopirellula marina DSM 3645 GN=DSM3645_18026 PE=4 SV=1: PP2C_2 [Tuwongella immobilis]